jgi:hypothetical protein
MYTKQALYELGVATDLTGSQKQKLDDDGFFIVEGMLSRDDCTSMSKEFEDIYASESDKGGHEVHVEPGARRVSNIFNKTQAYDKCLELGPVLAAAHYLLGEIKVHGANMRDPVKGYGAQDLHADVPKHFDEDWWVLNAMVLFDDMTLDNGPTRIVPGSHHWAPINVPFVNQGDWEPRPPSPEDQTRAPADLGAPYPNEVLVEAPAGSAIILNSSMWHAGTRKNSDAPRRLLHLTYTRRDLPQQLVQLDYVTPELYGRMNSAHRYLLEIDRTQTDEVLRQPKRAHATWWR